MARRMLVVAVLAAVAVLLFGALPASAFHPRPVPGFIHPSRSASAVPLSSRPTAGESCDGFAGAWTGFEPPTTPLYDEYYLDWRAGYGEGAFTSVMIRGGGWTIGKGQLSPDNTTAMITFDTGTVLHGNVSDGCLTIMWDNGSVWKKKSGIDYVHIIAMNHLDVGYNGIPGLGLINNILNIYFGTYFPRAIAIADALRQLDGEERLVYTTHPWLLHLYLHCPDNFTLSGIVLQCPSAEDVQAMRLALQRGDIYFHAAAFNTEYENAFNVEMVNVQFQLARDIADELGLPRPTVVSLRDVPGTTRSLIPILIANNITSISIGVNGGSPAPSMPNPGIWRDPNTNTSVLYMQTGQGIGYPNNPGPDPTNPGGMGPNSCVQWPGLGHALCWAFRTDNSGPPESVDEVVAQWEIARWQFPGARVVASTYENFTAQLATVAGQLPVATCEVGDTWVTSTSADPWKMVFYREASRAYAACLHAGQCDIHDPRVIGFTRLLAKLPEHTWGMPDVNDFNNWTNVQFHAAQAAGVQAYIDTLNSYTEQRDIAMREGLRYLADHPLAAAVAARWANVQPFVPDVSTFAAVPQAQWSTPFSVKTASGQVTIGLDGVTGALSKLTLAGVDWADPSHLLGVYTYRTYNDTLLNAQQTCCYGAPNRQKVADPQQTQTTPTMTNLWVDNADTPRTFVALLTMPDLQHTYYGAPSVVWINYTVTEDDRVLIDLQIKNKTSTRLAEAHFFAFTNLLQPGDFRWVMDKIGGMVDPLEVTANGGLHQHGVQTGVYYASASSPARRLFVGTLDAFVVDPDTAAQPAEMFPQPLTPLTGPVRGFYVQLMQNAFSTNTPLYSWDSEFRWRFEINAAM